MPRHTHTRARSAPVRRTLGAVAAGSGAALAQFLLDPASGRARRARLAGTLRAAVGRSAPSHDQALGDKIRSEVFGADECSAYDIHADAAGDDVALPGQVTHPDEPAALERAGRRRFRRS